MDKSTCTEHRINNEDTKSAPKRQKSISSCITTIPKSNKTSSDQQFTQTPKRKKTNMLLVDYEKRIRTPSQLNTIIYQKNQPMSSILHKCSKFIKMADANDDILAPNKDKVTEA